MVLMKEIYFLIKHLVQKIKLVGLDKTLEFLKEGDTLVVWKLDRLGRSLAHLISVITDLKIKIYLLYLLLKVWIQQQLLK